MTKVNPLWGGRFTAAPSAVLQELNQSLTVDMRLAKYDIWGSKVHCKMLAATKIISRAEAKKIVQGLDKIAQQLAAGKVTFKPELEDIHMNIEAALLATIGAVAGKLHIARSRNDQVVTAFKLWMRDAWNELDYKVKQLQLALLTQAEQHTHTIMPGFTHGQPAQPLVLAHHLLAYFEMFKRDRVRLRNAKELLNEAPLGAAALAGTSFPIDRFYTANALKFAAPTANSLDSVSDRDFVVDYLNVAALVALHLSRLATEIILWNSYQFGFIKLPDALTTGSSIMPQKRNPDGAELIRAKAGTIIGSLVSVLTILKGLPLGYAKDLQEDKAPVFTSHDTLILALTVMRSLVADLLVDKEKMYQAAQVGFTTATELANWLVTHQGFSFRQAHKISGTITKLAEERACKLSELDIATLQRIEPKIDSSIYKVLTIEAAVKNKTSFGGTAPSNVKQAIKQARSSL